MNTIGPANVGQFAWAAYVAPKDASGASENPRPAEIQSPADAKTPKTIPTETREAAEPGFTAAAGPGRRIANDSLKSLLHQAGDMLEDQDRMLAEIDRTLRLGQASRAYRDGAEL